MYLSTSFLSTSFLSTVLLIIFLIMLKKYWSYIFDDQIGEWNGVSVYSNKRYENDEMVKNYYNGVFTGIKWQCVEYARRYLIITRGITFSEVTSAFEIPRAHFTTLNGDNVIITNDLQEGSLIVWPGINSPHGHVAVVSSILKNGVTVVEQNYSNSNNNFNHRFIPSREIDSATIVTCKF